MDSGPSEPRSRLAQLARRSPEQPAEVLTLQNCYPAELQTKEAISLKLSHSVYSGEMSGIYRTKLQKIRATKSSTDPSRLQWLEGCKSDD